MLVPCTLRLWTDEPAFVKRSLPLSGAAMLAGAMAKSLKVTCTAPAGAPTLRVSACAATTKARKPNISATIPSATPALPTGSRSRRVNRGTVFLLVVVRRQGRREALGQTVAVTGSRGVVGVVDVPA